MPRHECDLARPPHRHLSSDGRADGTSIIGIRNFFREGWYVRQTDSPRNIPGGIAEGLRRAFPLPASGAFEDLIEALDRVDGQEHPSEERGKP